ncbi:MAG TPA: T9SS type A sorting domain-containing protein [Ignavibacteria bacterium]|nr:T9SS type A sorting domain-containing protein [Ignavibacteria bacterium]
MKRIIFLLAYLTLSFPLFAQVIPRTWLQPNNLKAEFGLTGIFNQGLSPNTAGCEWPIGSGNHVCFTAGLTIAAMVNDSFAMTAASYRGEWSPGYYNNGVYTTNPSFRYYSVKVGDNCSNNPDYANWGLMVPYGAPFKDVNQNGVYDCGIDIPGMPNAKQTIFIVVCDGDESQHSIGEGFGGGVLKPLLKSQLAITAWGYDYPSVNNAHFIKYEITNKSNSTWKKTFLGLYSDPDIGDATDDWGGCSPELDLSFAYNKDNNDPEYGVNPPAFGFAILRSPYVFRNGYNDTLGMTSYNLLWCNGSGGPDCQNMPNGEPLAAYRCMQGFKKDGTPVLNPLITIGTRKTKFWYSGDPETNTGWNASYGYIPNCGGDTTMTTISHAGCGSVMMLMNTGSDSLEIIPNQIIEYTIAQFVERGTSNLNSVTLLKNKVNSLKDFYNSIANSTSISHNNEIIIKDYKLYQNYPNPFNPETKIKFDIPKTSQVQLEVFDISGKLIATLVNEQLNSGQYTIAFDASKLSSGVYIYRMRAGEVVYSNKMLLLK